MATAKFLGVFVSPLYVQVEGLQRVFDNLESIGTHAICTLPYVFRPSAAGKRFPPLHIDGYERLAARPVWGKREVDLERFLTYAPQAGLYEGCPYKPDAKPVPAELDATLPQRMIEEARRRGMQAHILIHPFLAPRLRLEDHPVYVDASSPTQPPVAASACPNSPAAEAYGLAQLQDIVQNYGEIDGLIPDWVEFGAYRLEDHFSCFCPHCERRARDLGLDWGLIKKDVTALWDHLHALTPRGLEHSRRLLRNPSELLELLMQHPGWVQLLKFKADSIVGFYLKMRRLLDRMGHEEMELAARGWPPPWNRSSGMDYRALAETCGTIAPKLFTFDYSVLPRWYGQSLVRWNPELSESLVLDALVDWMNLHDDLEQRSFAHYHIPAPEELHPARLEVYRTRVDEVVAQVAGKARCRPFAHAYLPESQWKRMVALLRDSQVDGMWVQMYGYLSDRKLGILRDMWH